MLLAERLGGVVLPVRTRRMPDALERAIANTRPEVVLGLGLAGLRTQVAVERVAINWPRLPLPRQRRRAGGGRGDRARRARGVLRLGAGARDRRGLAGRGGAV